MDTKHLEYFVTVANMGSINRAAQAMYMSQPHLGKIIQNLEYSIGFPLFTRSNQGVVLTSEGIRFYRLAQRIISELANLLNHSDSNDFLDNSLSVSMTKYSHIMESFIQTVRRYKDLPIYTHRLQEGDPNDVIEDIYNHRANIGVLHFGYSQQKNMMLLFRDHQLSYHPLGRMTPHILISSNHPLLVERKPITLENLSNYGFIRYEEPFDDFTQEFFSCYNRKQIYTVNRATLLHLLSTTDFYSVGIQSFSSQQSAYQVKSFPINGCSGMLEFGYIVPTSTQLNSITTEFINDLKQRLSQQSV